MSGKINITQSVFDRMQTALNTLEQIEQRIQNNPNEKIIADAIVDSELAIGTFGILNSLTGRVDEIARNQFSNSIIKLADKLQGVRNKIEILAAKITSVSNINSKEEMPDNFQELKSRIDAVFTKLEYVNESYITDPALAKNDLALVNKEIIALRTAPNNGLFVEDISRAREKLEELEAIVDLWMPAPESKQIQTESKRGPIKDFIFADQNQYDAKYDALYKGNAANYKQSACTAIAGQFILDIFNGAQPEQFNQIMMDGQKANARIMNEQPPVDGEHFAFADILSAVEFKYLQKMPLTEELENDFFLNFIDLEQGAIAISKKLDKLVKAQNDQNVNQMGMVITARGESYALVSVNNGSVLIFFDSHGHQPLTGSPNAYAKAFNSIKDAAEFLAKRMPFVNDVDTIKDNTAQITAVCLEADVPKSILESDDEDFNNRVEVKLPLEEENEIPVVNLVDNTRIVNAQEFFKAVQALEKKDEDGFFEASGKLLDLSDAKCLFAMTDHEPKPIGDRVFFHLYHIHRKEAPQKLTNDINYGANAFQDVEKTTPEERLRATQRAMTEIAFAGAEEAINDGNQEQLAEFFKILEGMKLDSKDLPKDKFNMAHMLFERLYNNYLAAWEKNKLDSEQKKSDISPETMTHPWDGAFLGDFGRNAFLGRVTKQISSAFKLEAIQQVRNELKAHWLS